MNLSRREFIQRTAGVFGTASVLKAAVTGTRPKSIPNILLILVDDLGNRSLSCFGSTVPTPNMDRLANGGMVFTNAHAAPMCAPTRDEMFTGLPRAGRARPGADVPFFTNHLQKLGYTNGMAGKWFVGRVFDPRLRGFDEACIMVNGYRHWAPDIMVWGSGGMFRELNQPPVEGRLNEWEISLDKSERHHAMRLADRYAEDVAVDFLSDFMQRSKDNPFFAYYSSKLTHVPHAANPDSDPYAVEAFRQAFGRAYDRNLQGVTDAARRNLGNKSTKTASHEDYRKQGIAYIDKMVGRLMVKLDELNLRGNTIVLVTSDNGNSALDPLPEGAERLPGRKGDSREGGTRVPLIVSWPGKVRPGSKCHDLVHVQDFLPTFVEIAGGSPTDADRCDGHSFLPQLLGRKGNARQWFIGTGAHPSIWLERVAEELGKPDLEAYRLVWVQGTKYKLYNDGRFYNLEKDLAESHHIASGQAGPEGERIRRQFQQILIERNVIVKT